MTNTNTPKTSEIEERAGLIAFKGNGMTLTGHTVGEGDDAPNFLMVANDLSEKNFNDYKGKTVLLITVPSLDTGVCDMEARRFNKETEKFGDDVAVIVASMDLPFAQARWQKEAGVNRIETLSDYREHSLAMNYGVLIKELRLLARCVFVINKEGKITYVQLVPEVTDEPDYDAALKAVEQAS